METEATKDVGVYKIPCKDCSLNYFGETGRGLSVRLKEHQRDYGNMSNKNVLVKHSFQENHRINWRDATILYRDNNVGNRRLVEGACINTCKSMEGNKPFTQEDYFVDKIICSITIKDLNLLNSHHIANPDAAPSFSPAQVTGLDPPHPVAGTYAEDGESQDGQRPRRSRRLAGLPIEDGIT